MMGPEGCEARMNSAAGDICPVLGCLKKVYI